MAGAAAFLNFDFYYSSVQSALSQLLAQLFAGALELFERRVAFRFFNLFAARKEKIEHSFFRVLFGLLGNFGDFFLAYEVDTDLDEVPDHRFNVAADIANLGKFGSLNF